MKIRSPSPRPSERYLVKHNTMVLEEEIQVIRWEGGGVTSVGDWLMVSQDNKIFYDIIKWPKSDQLVFRQVFI